MMRPEEIWWQNRVPSEKDGLGTQLAASSHLTRGAGSPWELRPSLGPGLKLSGHVRRLLVAPP